MLFDGEQREAGWFRDKIFDVCVIGSGPAGMSLALKLAERGWSVGLFEGGGFEPTRESSDIYKGRNVGTDYYPLEISRLRYFGGASNHWAGWCRNLESFDFEPHEDRPHSGWPIRKSDLDPYQSEAGAILDLGPPNPSFDLFGGDAGSLIRFEYRWSAPTRFGEKYRNDLSASAKIEVFLNTTLVDMNLTGGYRQVESAVFRSYAKPEAFAVKARHFALCLGGLENPRFLLNANRQISVGIGNENDLVGRFFAEHMHFHVGRMFLSPELQREFPEHLFFRSSPEFVQRNRTENFAIRLDGLVHEPDSMVSSMFRNTICSSTTLGRLAAAIQGSETLCFDGTVMVVAGQVLDPQSRVRLGNELDRFGSRRIELDWRLSELDKRTLYVAAAEFGKQLALRNVGRLRIHDWVLDRAATFPKIGEDEVGGHHHMCTTRMSDDPRAGVVDRNCRVHSVDNLYVGGSSVFSTPGFANPTYTIVQLALRLADHLDSRLKAAT